MAVVGSGLWLFPFIAHSQTATQTITWSGQIAPIVHTHCVSCHRPNSVGPFSLLSFDDIRPRAELVAAMVAGRVMPPWKPVGGDGRGVGVFQNERALSNEDIDLIQQWAATGAPEGNPADAPNPPTFSDDWQIGQPDLIVTPDAPFVVEAGTGVAYRNFVVPVALAEARWVRAVELRPSTATTILSARIYLDARGPTRLPDATDPEPGEEGLMPSDAVFPNGHSPGWTAGTAPTVVADALAWRLDAGADIVLQLRLHGGSEHVSIQPEIGVYFAPAVSRVDPISIVLQSKTIDIPPDAVDHRVEDRFRLPAAVDLVAVYPHAHHIARQIIGTATLPDGREISLLHVEDWDLGWQEEYRYREPIHLPEGTVLRMVTVYDNSAGNRRNPHTPAQRVTFGSGSGNEMAELTLHVVPTDETGSENLRQGLSVKSTRDDILGHQARLRIAPEDHESLSALAGRYLDIGQVDLAIERLQEAIRIAPDYAEAHFNLGNAYIAAGSSEQAITAYRRAVAVRPEYGAAHNNLGATFQSTGDGVAAVAHYRLAVRFNDRDPNARYNLARALEEEDQFDDALVHYQQALALGPPDAELRTRLARVHVSRGEYDVAVEHYRLALEVNQDHASALVDLAWLRATAPDAELRDAVSAVTMAQRATELVGNEHPLVLDVLATAYAANGQFDLAVTTSRRALEYAQANLADYQQLATAIESRISMFLSYRPFRMTRPASEQPGRE